MRAFEAWRQTSAPSDWLYLLNEERKNEGSAFPAFRLIRLSIGGEDVSFHCAFTVVTVTHLQLEYSEAGTFSERSREYSLTGISVLKIENNLIRLSHECSGQIGFCMDTPQSTRSFYIALQAVSGELILPCQQSQRVSRSIADVVARPKCRSFTKVQRYEHIEDIAKTASSNIAIEDEPLSDHPPNGEGIGLGKFERGMAHNSQDGVEYQEMESDLTLLCTSDWGFEDRELAATGQRDVTNDLLTSDSFVPYPATKENSIERVLNGQNEANDHDEHNVKMSSLWIRGASSQAETAQSRKGSGQHERRNHSKRVACQIESDSPKEHPSHDTDYEEIDSHESRSPLLKRSRSSTCQKSEIRSVKSSRDKRPKKRESTVLFSTGTAIPEECVIPVNLNTSTGLVKSEPVVHFDLSEAYVEDGTGRARPITPVRSIDPTVLTLSHFHDRQDIPASSLTVRNDSSKHASACSTFCNV